MHISIESIYERDRENDSLSDGVFPGSLKLSRFIQFFKNTDLISTVTSWWIYLKSLTCLDISFFRVSVFLWLNTIFIICERALDLLIVKCCQLPHSKEMKTYFSSKIFPWRTITFSQAGPSIDLDWLTWTLAENKWKPLRIETFVSDTLLTSIE